METFMTDHTFTREDVKDSIERSVPHHIEKVEYFRGRLTGDDPLEAFSCGEEAMRSAACLKIMLRIIKDIDDDVPLETIVEKMHDRILYLASFGRRSTSAIDNHAHLEELAALTEMFKMMQGFYKASDEYEA